MLFVLVIVAFESDTEASFTQEIDDLVAVRNVIFHCHSVIAFTVVEAEIDVIVIATAAGKSSSRTFLLVHYWLNLFDAFTDIENLRKVKNLCAFVLRQMMHLQFEYFCWCQRVVIMCSLIHP